MEDDRFSGKQIHVEAQWRLNALISSGGFSTYKMVFRYNPADLCGWEDKDEDLARARPGFLDIRPISAAAEAAHDGAEGGSEGYCHQ